MIDVSTLPTLQAAASKTFTRPPFDHSLTIPEIYAFHALKSPDHPIFIYAEDSAGTNRTIYYPEAYAAIQRGHNIVTCKHEELAQGPKGPNVVGILANIDSITYVTFSVGIMHAGLAAFPISTRNSVVGIAHLIRTTGLRLLFVSPDSAMQRLASDACTLLENEGIDVHILPVPQFNDLYNQDKSCSELAPVRSSPDPVVLILHSSGSTAQPKPVPFLDSNFLKWGLLPYYGEIDMGGMAIAAHSVPIFHAMGAVQIIWTICAGTVMACFRPVSPPIIPTPDIFLREIVATKSQIVFCVPIFVEAWARSPGNIPILRNLSALIYAGAPMTRSVGDQLVAAGINLVPFYGATESGCLTIFCPKSTSTDHWSFFRISPHLTMEMALQDENEDGEIVEPIVISSEVFTPNVINTTYQGRPAYATSDLLLRHPTNKDLYSVYGRVDDQLMLSTGEKTNPVPLETLFLQNKEIAAAIMFGRGRFQNGVLIQPTTPFDPEDEEKLVAYRNLIWPTVEKVNEFAPAHSRLFKEMIMVTNPKKPLEFTPKGTPRRQMIMVTNPKKPLEFTPKGTPRRQVCLKTYEKDINALYEAVKDSSQTDISIPELWTPDNAVAFVSSAVRRVIRQPFAADQDIFQHGCDSLQATWIKNSLLRAVRSSKNKANVHCIPLNFVYAHPSIQQLGDYFWMVLTGTASMNEQSRAAQIETRCLQMQSLVTKNTVEIPTPAWTASPASVDPEIVLLTGSTGRLGCHILKQLMERPDVLKVYALNRPSVTGQTREQRQQEACSRWGIDLQSNFEKVVFLDYDTSKERLGLTDGDYRCLQTTVTTIIHNGWRVDFNIGLGSFENLITGTRRLLDLSLQSTVSNGPKFVFVSSISVFSNIEPGQEAPETSVSPSLAAGFGYGESKWVAEAICAKIGEATSLSVSIVRVGQLSGDRLTGRWNVKEWVPAMIKRGKAVGSLPSRNEYFEHSLTAVTWLPVDDAAKAIVHLLKSPSASPSCSYISLVHPSPVDWNKLFGAAAKSLQLDFIAYEDWLKKLQSHRENLANGAAEAPDDLTEFFLQGNLGDGRFTMDRTLELCPSLRTVEPLEPTDILKYLAFWKF
ncbi:Polyketide synthase HetM [Leucoagaricus sp. SymC.cos]|nr:Polyketide synthase HetM [Leucoagaricus sp. SymC.cos]